MSDMSQKELDKLFQQASKRHDFDYNPEAWEQMKILLDRENRRRRMLWLWFGGLGALILLTLFFLVKDDHKQVIPTSTHTEDQISSTTNTNDKETTAPPSGVRDTSASAVTEVDEQQLSQMSAQRDSAITITGNATRRDDIAIRDSKTSGETISPAAVITAPKTPQDANPTKPMNLSDAPYDEPVTPDTGSTSRTAADSAGVSQVALITLSPLPSTQMPVINTIDTVSSNITFAPGSLVANLSGESPRNNIIQVGVLAGGYVSSAGIGNFNGFGWKVGGQATYLFKDKYSVSLGAGYGKTKYDAGEGEYSPPYGFWTRKIPPKSTSAECSILEVPMLMGFFPKGYVNNGFFINAGVVSYFMRSEHYHYSYDLPDPDLIRYWGAENDSRSWFGIGQASVGYQYILPSNFALQFAPYIQIPFTGIGHGDVKLWSIGLNLAVNFSL